MTVLLVATGKLSVTMESVYPSVPAILSTTGAPMNAGVGVMENKNKSKKKSLFQHFALFTVRLDFIFSLQTVTNPV